MKLFLIATLLGVATAGRLENTYLPPSNAPTAGGAGHIEAPYAPAGSFRASASSLSGRVAAEPVAILKYTNDNNGDGTYTYNYETADGIRAEESGYQKSLGGRTEEDSSANIVTGSYSYTGPDGVTYTVTYTADENGFRATGDHLPTPPPIPEAIARSLEVIAAAEAAKSRQAPQGQFGGYADASAPAQSGYPSGRPNNQYLPPASPPAVTRQNSRPRNQYLPPQ